MKFFLSKHLLLHTSELSRITMYFRAIGKNKLSIVEIIFEDFIRGDFGWNIIFRGTFLTLAYFRILKKHSVYRTPYRKDCELIRRNIQNMMGVTSYNDILQEPFFPLLWYFWCLKLVTEKHEEGVLGITFFETISRSSFCFLSRTTLIWFWWHGSLRSVRNDMIQYNSNIIDVAELLKYWAILIINSN